MDKRGFRTNLFKVLFQFEFCEPEQMQDKLSLFLQEEGIVREQDYKSLEKKLTDIINHLPELDAKIEAYSNGWKKERIGKAELAILRLAIYEVLFDDIPDAVAINEAVELAKLYTDEKAPGFINGILGKVAREKEL
ncbi:MAG: transcription antitermination factor NusB [Lachnospira sp.]|nr:transcription antitermination factor NusB [Lachnospira sp.]